MDKVSILQGENTNKKKFTEKDRKIKKSLIYTFCLNPTRVVEDFSLFKGFYLDPVFLDEKYKYLTHTFQGHLETSIITSQLKEK